MARPKVGGGDGLSSSKSRKRRRNKVTSIGHSHNTRINTKYKKSFPKKGTKPCNM